MKRNTNHHAADAMLLDHVRDYFKSNADITPHVAIFMLDRRDPAGEHMFEMFVRFDAPAHIAATDEWAVAIVPRELASAYMRCLIGSYEGEAREQCENMANKLAPETPHEFVPAILMTRDTTQLRASLFRIAGGDQ